MQKIIVSILFLAALLLTTGMSAGVPVSQADDPNPPSQPVKLIFIHHSTGENWLTDGYGDLGRTLDQNNYFVSDTNYGWGPDAIGDRTDIPNWTEWFRSDQTNRYMQALFSESGQNSSYTRTLSDPGGENEIIMFKSCFPNSALEGNPNDPPSAEGELTVGHAKYVYNEILQYFASRPDKLFIVITAPPLSDSTYAANARAFNNWLLNNWLSENSYTGKNVAVFDFYNVLTAPANHHRWANGQIEHSIASNKNTTSYPSGDDHPSVEGSRKATSEFIPLLNIFYHRWKSSAPAAPGATATTAPAAGPTTETQPGSQTLDDFENGSATWEPYQDDTGKTTLTCETVTDVVYGGGQALRLDYNVAANGWVTCAHFFSEPQNFEAYNGIKFYLRASQGGQTMHVDLYAGPDTQRESYIYSFETPSGQDWMPVEVRWSDFLRASWEENANAPFDSTKTINGFAFGFPADETTASIGQVWMDDFQLLGNQPAIAQPESTKPAEPAVTQSVEQPTAKPAQPAATQPAPRRPALPICRGAIGLPVGAVILFWLTRRKNRSADSK